MDGFSGVNAHTLTMVAALVSLWGLAVVVLADWNMTCDQLLATGWPQRRGLELRPPSGVDITCWRGLRTIDVVAYSAGISPLIDVVYPIIAVPWGAAHRI